jgi:hypothetical protein
MIPKHKLEFYRKTLNWSDEKIEELKRKHEDALKKEGKEAAELVLKEADEQGVDVLELARPETTADGIPSFLFRKDLQPATMTEVAASSEAMSILDYVEAFTDEIRTMADIGSLSKRDVLKKINELRKLVEKL